MIKHCRVTLKGYSMYEIPRIHTVPRRWKCKSYGAKLTFLDLFTCEAKGAVDLYHVEAQQLWNNCRSHSVNTGVWVTLTAAARAAQLRLRLGLITNCSASAANQAAQQQCMRCGSVECGFIVAWDYITCLSCGARLLLLFYVFNCRATAWRWQACMQSLVHEVSTLLI